MRTELEGFYPAVTLEMVKSLRLLRRMLAHSDAVLDKPDCPYSEELKQALRLFLMPEAAAQPNVASVELGHDEVDQQLIDAYNTLLNIKTDPAGMDSRDQIAWVKAAVSLIQSVVETRQRNLDQRAVAEFKRRVVKIMDEVMEPAQRSRMVNLLEGAV